VRGGLTLIAALLLALAGAAPAGAATPQVSQHEVESEVMCPVCGTLLELAEAPQAQRQKAFIARMISEGRSKEEIKDALVAEYGQEVLALPEGSGFSLSAYLVPIVAFVVAAIALALGVLRWRRGGGGGGPPGPGAAPPAGPSAEDRARLDADLARYDL
jgi:cytochrome c-type biogenesis protein CcmH/NrfF